MQVICSHAPAKSIEWYWYFIHGMALLWQHCSMTISLQYEHIPLQYHFVPSYLQINGFNLVTVVHMQVLLFQKTHQKWEYFVIRTHTHPPTYKHPPLQVHTQSSIHHTHTHACMHTHTCMHTQSHMHVCIHILTRSIGFHPLITVWILMTSVAQDQPSRS